MAKRRKSYRSYPESHAGDAIGQAKATRKRANMVREALAEGNCRDALAQLATLNRHVGRVAAHAHSAGYKHKGAGVYKVALGLERRVYAKCMK